MNKFCTDCGKELNENAEVCLNCGILIKKESKEQNKGLPSWAIALISIGIIFIYNFIIAISAFALY